MFVRIIRNVFGYVSFTVTGQSIERFLNLVARSGIVIWDVRKMKIKEKDTLYAKVICSEYKLLHRIALKSGVKIKISKKYGIPFIINKYKKRSGLILGFGILFFTLHVLSLYVWVVNVEGNNILGEDEIKAVVQELGLKPGILKKYIDVREIQRDTMIRLDNVSWISVNIEGCFATVSVNEKVIAPELLTKDTPCNIKSKKSGQVIRTEVYSGTQEVKNGDAVVEGQLLVSGIVEDSFGGTYLTHASAKVIALTKRELNQKISLHQQEKIKTGKKIFKRRLHIFGLDIPITFNFKEFMQFDVSFHNDVFKVCGVPLPISLYTEEYDEVFEQERIISNDEAKQIAFKNIEEIKTSVQDDLKIIREDIFEDIIDGIFCLTVVIYCEENIAFEEEMQLLAN